MEADWDLHAVVRSCCATASATTAAAERDYVSFSAAKFQDLFEPRRDPPNAMELDLHDLCKPFLTSRETASISSASEMRMVKELPQQTQFQQKQQPFSVLNLSKPASSQHPSSRSKKRKNSLKKVCHVAAENLSSDMWSWRKYGQKPIKGSPYPRGYYRCSTSKGCLARKQVERNRSDPGMFIVTYTAEHNHPIPTHRNSLAGSTRLKPSAAEAPTSDEPKKPSSSSELSPATMEKPESSRDDTAEAEDMDDDDGFSGPSNAAVDDDFFAGLEDFAADGGGECFSGHFPGTLQFPWLVGGAAAATAAGGG